MKYPETRRVDIVDEQFGTRIADPYRWLENDIRRDPEVAAWVEVQNRLTDTYLAELPGRDIFRERLAVMLDYEQFTAPIKRGALSAASDHGIVEAARQIETRLDARVGLFVHDIGSGRTWRYRSEERFPMASTFKVLACGALLARVDAGQEDLERKVRIERADLVTHAPVTETHVGREMSLGALCEATMRTSDNTAANEVLDALGGPAALTRFMRGLGDQTTRLDRRETDLNEATPGDPRDTTSPEAMAAALQKLVLGDALAAPSREQLTRWLVGNAVGGPLLRAGFPGDWRIGDRTGAGGHGTRGVVAVLWPPQRAPVVAVVYITGTSASMIERNAAIAEMGKLIAGTVTAAR